MNYLPTVAIFSRVARPVHYTQGEGGGGGGGGLGMQDIIGAVTS